MAALHEVFGTGSHVVAQVVEAELIVRPEGDVSVVCRTTLGGIGAMFVDTVYAEAVEHV